MKKSSRDSEASRGNSPQSESETTGTTNIYKTAKNLFTKKFSIKLKAKDTKVSVGGQSPSEMSGAGKVNKFVSNIPGKTTSQTGHAFKGGSPTGS